MGRNLGSPRWSFLRGTAPTWFDKWLRGFWWGLLDHGIKNDSERAFYRSSTSSQSTRFETNLIDPFPGFHILINRFSFISLVIAKWFVSLFWLRGFHLTLLSVVSTYYILQGMKRNNRIKVIVVTVVVVFLEIVPNLLHRSNSRSDPHKADVGQRAHQSQSEKEVILKSRAKQVSWHLLPTDMWLLG